MNSQSVIQSTKWSAITEVLSRCLTPLINLFLARILAPQVFGVIAALTIVTSLAETFTDAGFQKYLVQHDFVDDEDRRKSTDVAFWTNFGFSCLLWLVIFLFQDNIAILIGCRGYGLELSILSIEIPLVSLYSIQNALYQRDFRFKDLFPIRMAGCVIPFIVTVPLALLWHNCWALIAGLLCKDMVQIMLMTCKSTWKPELYYDFFRLKEMCRFSLLILADSLVIWFTGYAGTLIISQQLDLYYLGIFRTGQMTSYMYLNFLFGIANPVFFSALSRLQNDKSACDDLYFKVQKFSAYILIPLGFGMFVYRDFVTWLLLGNQWGDAIYLLGIYSLACVYMILTAQYNSNYFRALGRPGVALFVQSIFGVTLVISYYYVVHMDFNILCSVAALVCLSYGVVSTIVMCGVFKVSFTQMMLNMYKPTFGALIMSAFALAVRTVYSGNIWTVATVLMCIVVYFGVLSVSADCREDFKKVYGMFVKKA